MTFGLDRYYRLTDVKVVPLAEWQTNHSVLPLWHLVSDSKSAPTKFFFYGQDIDGMKPFLPGTQPKPLETNVVYRLFLSAGSVNGQHDFQIGGKPPTASTNNNCFDLTLRVDRSYVASIFVPAKWHDAQTPGFTSHNGSHF